MRKTIVYLVFLAVGIMTGLGLAGLFRSSSTTGSTKTSEALSVGRESDAGGTELNVTAEGTGWCAEHRVPESECTQCNPELIDVFRASNNWCGEHNLPESHCRQCNPSLTFPQEPLELVTAEPVTATVFFPANETGCTSDQAVIRFASERTAERVGLKVEPALPAVAATRIEAPAEILFDETRTAAMTTAVPATVIRWLVEPGQLVSEGQPLAEVESPDVAQLKSDYLTAHADWTRDQQQLARARELALKDLISQSELQDVEASEKAARSEVDGAVGRLRAAGLVDSDLQDLQDTRDTGPRWLLRATMAATVLERRAPLGEQVPAGSAFGLLGRPNALWIQAHVREQDLTAFRLGQKVTFSVDGDALARTVGEVIWVSQYLESDTRTGIVRARVMHPDPELRAHLFGRILLQQSNGTAALLVSKDAVQWEGCCHVVFVQEAVDRYRPHKVAIDRGDRDHYLVSSGLEAGDLVVTAGSFLLKTELKKESLGAGCVDE